MSTRERPIVLWPCEIRAGLEGRLTVLVRALRVFPHPAVSGWRTTDTGRAVAIPTSQEERRRHSSSYPYQSIAPSIGDPGDRLWAREIWSEGAGGIAYRATMPDDEHQSRTWRSATVMPRSAARLVWTVDGVLLTRLASTMTDEMARAHGHADREAFAVHWNRHRARRACWTWDADPWCWLALVSRVP